MIRILKSLSTFIRKDLIRFLALIVSFICCQLNYTHNNIFYLLHQQFSMNGNGDELKIIFEDHFCGLEKHFMGCYCDINYFSTIIFFTKLFKIYFFHSKNFFNDFFLTNNFFKSLLTYFFNSFVYFIYFH